MQQWLSRVPFAGFEEPLSLLLLPLFAIVARAMCPGKRGRPGMLVIPDAGRLLDEGFQAPLVHRRLLDWLRWTALVLGVLALARPQLVVEKGIAESRGIDVVLVLDISESMRQTDADGRSRLDAVRSVAREFMTRNSRDRIGIVAFKGQGYTLCPLTLDHRVAGMLLDTVSHEVIDDEGTAIGTAILVAVNRLRASESARKVMILFSDGVSNDGEVDPVTAASVAARYGVRIYAVGAGSGNTTPSGLDEEQLRRVAGVAGGRYFRAGNAGSLAETFRTIERLEESTLSSPVSRQTRSLFLPLLVLALLLFLCEAVLANTRLLRVP